jgi:hypothetical protein
MKYFYDIIYILYLIYIPIMHIEEFITQETELILKIAKNAVEKILA